MARKQIKYIHEGQYVAEVEIELVDSETGWKPTMSLKDAYQLDDIRMTLKQGDVTAAAKKATAVYEIKRIVLYMVKAPYRKLVSKPDKISWSLTS